MEKMKAYRSVWDAIEPTAADAAKMKARSALMVAIERAVASWGLTQAQAARRLKITQPRLNDLLRGKISKFSLDALIELASNAGLSVSVKIVRKAA
ncbi:MAG TPA: XRE family transcriptional regulator [Rhizomicrobium sp.]|jgi:predicted XRE-type DNA-binding protein